MPSRGEHLSKARNNKEFADSIKLENSTRVGWVLTVLFYSALHYIEAYNAQFNYHCRNHQDLHDNIVRNPVLTAISYDYSDLETFSWNARYRAVRYGHKEIEDALEYHAAIEKHITDLIADGH
jgi:hypothetical protein